MDSSVEPLYKDGALPAPLDSYLSYGTLCHAAIEELLACCTHLSLNGCANMHDMNWILTIDRLHELSSIQVPSNNSSPSEDDTPVERLLQNLNCVGCPNITKVVIPPVVCVSHLTSLDLSLSTNRKEVDVACSNMYFLNLSNCCSLESLKLECPRLTCLFLQSCNIREEVESAISQCTMLASLDVHFCPKVYAVHFKCNKKLLREYPNLFNFTKDLFQIPGMSSTINMEHIKKHCYGNHPSIKPFGTIPLGPDIDFL